MSKDLAGDVVQALGDLTVGDVIEAWHEGRRHNRGRVLQTVPSMGMFWLLDSGTGTRKLVDFEALLVRRVPNPESRSAASLA
ncbi:MULTISPECIES: hypothetical protein [unclassified Pseudarthrobacter]|uniref:hypothetical protein n=1 Tax=unclassified Pseudarthrobacter TaxID=2647000 RepID=UPI00363036CC